MERLTSSANTARRLRTDFLYKKTSSSSLLFHGRRGAGTQSCSPLRTSLVTLPIAGVLARAVDHVELLERAARADRHACQRRLGEMAWHLGLVAQALIQSLQQRASPGQH